MSLTQQDIDNRNYTYVSLMRHDGSFFAFLVASPYKLLAEHQAQQYMNEKGIQPFMKSDGEPAIWFYPRNYTRRARILFLEGKF